jgi:hypothetical protein
MLPKYVSVVLNGLRLPILIFVPDPFAFAVLVTDAPDTLLAATYVDPPERVICAIYDELFDTVPDPVVGELLVPPI